MPPRHRWAAPEAPGFAVSVVLATLVAFAAPTARADTNSARSLGVAWLLKQQRGDGAWVASDLGNGGLPVQTTSVALLALKNAGLSRSPSFAASLAYLSNADVDSVDSSARKSQALAIARASQGAQVEVDHLYGLRNWTTTWSGYGGNATDVVDTALGLRALRTADTNYLSKLDSALPMTVCTLLGGVISPPSGGLAMPAAVTTSQRPSVLATALMLEEFELIRQLRPSVGYNCAGRVWQLADAVNGLQTWLLAQQNGDGGFSELRQDGSRGASSVMLSASAYHSLSVLASPSQGAQGAMASALNWLLGQQQSNGAWRGDALVTAYALASLPAATGAQLVDSEHNGLTDAVEAALTGSPTQADARNLIKAPTLSSNSTGTPSSQSPTATTSTVKINTAYALGPTVHILSFDPNGPVPGVPPFRVTGGLLPPGMTLDSGSGQIYGTPNVSGAFSFQVTDGAGNSAWDVIDVQADSPVVQAVPMPWWSSLLLAVGLVGVLARQHRQHRRLV